jgi:hypothetical protein
MKIHTLLDGRAVQILDVVRSGSQAYVTYIDGTGTGPLLNRVFSTSAFDSPTIVLSSSATWVA